MDAFSYLSVLLSIILGLAITQVLQGYRGLLLSRSRLKLYAPTVIWSGLLLVLSAQFWWASFGLAEHTEWTFATFSVILLQTVLLYMMTALVLPDMPPEQEVDLRAHYFRERRPFFSISLVMLGASILQDWMLEGQLPELRNLAFHAIFGVISATALLTARPRVHEVLAFASTLFIASYIALLFSELGS